MDRNNDMNNCTVKRGAWYGVMLLYILSQCIAMAETTEKDRKQIYQAGLMLVLVVILVLVLACHAWCISNSLAAQ